MIRTKLKWLIIVCLLAGIAWLTTVLIAKQLNSSKDTILFIPKTIDKSVEFWQVLNQGVMAAAKEYGMDVKVTGTTTETDIAGQIKLLEQAIQQKPNSIILAATDYNRIVPVANKIIASGIDLITVDSGLNGGVSESFIATNNYAAGRKAGEAMKSAIQSNSTLAIISFVKGSATAMERERGVRDSLSEQSDLKVTDTYYSDGSQERAYQLTVALMNNPSIDGIIGLNEPSTVGAAKAIKDLQGQSRVKLIGFDSSMDELAFLEEGILQAIVIQKPFSMGYLAVQTARRVLQGEKVSSLIDTGSEVITTANMYTMENQKLLFPFTEK
ncbi:substrate-binding domain-containing protein [Paenibacillus sp. N1-5-1-14]|uniref:substrate-binding domain-containing protein n=1 Tax=Paenibacillus radicibacter TaxID=2972488 RepID=UPI002159977B|nr:substrate-binding domain-containing protein [Paenibacillus radicibacter]MCR8645550.1 substrate-binding domain-containing protein [Paenibacillus radicibacter]